MQEGKGGTGKKDPAFYQNAKRPEGRGGVEMLERMNGGHHEELATWGFSHVFPSAGARMLDLGCGGGANLLRLLDLSEGGTAVGLDYSPTSVEMSKRTCREQIAVGRCEVVEGDVGSLPFADESFDFACAFETVYFWPDLMGGLREARRVLRGGGTLMICNEADGTHEADYEMVSVIEGMRVYRPEELDRALHEAGFPEVRLHREPSRSWIAFEAVKDDQEAAGHKKGAQDR